MKKCCENEGKSEKSVALFGNVAGGVSIISSFSVCHTICTGVVSLLSVFGIIIIGMPFAFLTEYALPIWAVASVLFLVSAYFYFRHRMIAKELIIFNFGAIVIGIPFYQLRQNELLLWISGGLFMLAAIIMFAQRKLSGKNKIFKM